VCDALGGDPPRSDFQVYATPVPYAVAPVKPCEGFSEDRASAINRLVTAALTLTSYLDACVISQDRLGGALQAGSESWASEQARVLTHYKRKAGFGMIQVADELELLVRISQSENIEDFDLGPEMIQKYQAYVREKGFIPPDPEIVSLLHLSKREIDRIHQTRLEVDPDEFGGTFYQVVDSAIIALREGGSHWTRLPETNPDWESK
jgi:hypothetical protein